MVATFFEGWMAKSLERYADLNIHQREKDIQVSRRVWISVLGPTHAGLILGWLEIPKADGESNETRQALCLRIFSLLCPHLPSSISVLLFFLLYLDDISDIRIEDMILNTLQR